MNDFCSLRFGFEFELKTVKLLFLVESHGSLELLTRLSLVGVASSCI